MGNSRVPLPERGLPPTLVPSEKAEPASLAARSAGTLSRCVCLHKAAQSMCTGGKTVTNEE